MGRPALTSRRRLSFSLRSLLLGLTALAVGLGMWVNGVREQGAAIAALKALYENDDGPLIFYDYQTKHLAGAWWYPFGDAEIAIDFDAQPAEPAWLHNLLGEDFFHNVRAVSISPSKESGTRPLADIARFRMLEHLDLNDAHLEGGRLWSGADVECLGQLSRLESLSLQDASALTDVALRAIGDIPCLQVLTLWRGAFTDDGLRHLGRLTKLRRLTLESIPVESGPQITDAGVAHLSGLVNLEELSIYAQKLKGASIQHLIGMQKLRCLTLISPLVHDRDLSPLASLVSLERLELPDSGIDGTGFAHLVGNPRLRSLFLARSHVGDLGLAQIARLPNLEFVNLCNTQVTCTGLIQLTQCQQLQTVVISPDVPGDIEELKRTLAPCSVEVVLGR